MSRVIDESGGGYLFPANLFSPISLSQTLIKKIDANRATQPNHKTTKAGHSRSSLCGFTRAYPLSPVTKIRFTALA